MGRMIDDLRQRYHQRERETGEPPSVFKLDHNEYRMLIEECAAMNWIESPSSDLCERAFMGVPIEVNS